MNVSSDCLRWFQFRRSGLAKPFSTPESAAGALSGIQAQILSAAGIALWNRSRKLTWRGCETRLFSKRSLVKLWGQRGTLHLYPSNDWPLIHGALSGRGTWQERLLERRGGDIAAWREKVRQVAEILRSRQTIGRRGLRETGLELDEYDLSSWGGIFADLVRLGEACHAGSEGNEGLFASRAAWLPNLVWNPPTREEANVEILRRYLAAYGPSRLRDFAYWRGVSVGEARTWLERFEPGTVVPITLSEEPDGEPLLALYNDVEDVMKPVPKRGEWPVRLLGRFDPLLLACRDKKPLINSAFYHRVWKKAGHIEATVLMDGRIAGTWRYRREVSGLVVEVFPFVPFRPAICAAISERAIGIAAFFGLPFGRIDFKNGEDPGS
ncbi:MAG: AlkZ family DNA glycosylase [Candidatus Riflebacteria bacterium]|nr:AlkZ family DNA glycosylase [Candidatus Riflebacteria bacterium]